MKLAVGIVVRCFLAPIVHERIVDAPSGIPGELVSSASAMVKISQQPDDCPFSTLIPGGFDGTLGQPTVAGCRVESFWVRKSRGEVALDPMDRNCADVSALK